MYNLKKVIASICVIAMMLTTVAFGATYSDVAEDSAYYEAVETLNKLEIVTGYGDGTYKPENGVTRAEMAALIARIQGYGDTAASSAVTGFADVPASHWASGYIANAASMGIINGYGDGNFGPEDPVLYEQAVKMVMATLGYTPYAEHNGGYPGGYISAAQRYNVSDGVSNATMGTQANRGTIAQLLTNAIDTPLMAQEKWSTNGDVEYSIYDGKDNPLKTLLSENLGYVKLRGVVTANAYVALEGDAPAINTEDPATITVDIKDNYDTTEKDFAWDEENDVYDGTVDTFLVGDTDAADFIGKSVIFYTKEVDNEYVVVSIAADTARNDSLEIDLTQFDAVDADNDKLSYYKTASAKTTTNVALNENVIVLYNNCADDLDVLDDDFTGANGRITLVDNDGKKGYDVIFVEVAETAVVDEVGEDYIDLKEAILDGDLATIDIDVDATDAVLDITKDGAKISYTDLAEWDVLSVIINPANANYIVAEVVSNSVVGTVTSKTTSTSSADVDSDSKGDAFKIDGTTYDVAEGAFDADKIKVGVGGTFYINKYGKIAAFNKDDALASGVAANYGYVVSVAADKDVVSGEVKLYAQIVTANGLETFEFKKNAKVDDVTIKLTGDDANVDVDADGDTSIDGDLEGEIVKYTVNASGLVGTVKTVAADDADFEAVACDETAEFVAEDTELGRKLLAADAKIFFINTDDATKSTVGTVASLADKEEYTVLGMYTEIDEDDVDATVVVLDASEARLSATASLAVVTSVGTTENEDAETVGTIGLIVDGAEVEVETTADAWGEVEDDLTVGDIVKVNINAAGKAAKVGIVWDADEDIRLFAVDEDEDLDELAPSYIATDIDEGTDETFVGGMVYNYNNKKVQFAADGPEYKLSQAKNIYVVDATGRNVEIDENGTTSSFKAFDNLYKEGVTTVTVKNDKTTLAEGASVAEAKKAADYVYIRTYDDKVADVVIVKGVTSIR